MCAKVARRRVTEIALVGAVGLARAALRRRSGLAGAHVGRGAASEVAERHDARAARLRTVGVLLTATENRAVNAAAVGRVARVERAVVAVVAVVACVRAATLRAARRAAEIASRTIFLCLAEETF